MIEVVPLGEYAKVFNGKTPAKTEQRSAGHPVLKIKDVDETGHFRGTFESFVDPEFAKKHVKKHVVANDILVLNAAHNADYVGSKTYRAQKSVDGAVATGEWLIARSSDRRLHQDYLWHWFQAPATRFEIRKQVKGIHLYPRDVAAMRIPLPPVDEQRRIAAILDKADAIRRKRQQALALADDFLKSVFLEMFGDPRSIQVTDILLDDVANISRGRFSPRPRNDPRYYNGPHPFIQTGEIAGSDGYMSDYRQTLNENGIKVSKSFPSGTVFVAIVGATIGATAISTKEFWCPDSVIGITPKNSDYPAEFIEYLLRFWRPVFVDRAPETARANINLQSLKPVPVPKLTNGEGMRFAQLYKGIHKFKCSLQRMDDQLFASLSQRAFRGEL